MSSLYFGFLVYPSCILIVKVAGVFFEAAFKYSFLEVDMNLFGVFIKCKRSRRKENIKRGVCFTCRNNVSIDVQSYRYGEIFR